MAVTALIFTNRRTPQWH